MDVLCLSCCMRLFEQNAEVQRLEAAVGSAPLSESTVTDWVVLAWYQRHANHGASRALARQAAHFLTHTPTKVAQHTALLARLQLLDAEACFLVNDHDQALELLSDLTPPDAAHGDDLVRSDAHATSAMIASSTGALARRDQALVDALECAHRAQDNVRVESLQANQALYALGLGNQEIDEQWELRFTQQRLTNHPVAQAYVATYMGWRSRNLGQFAKAIQHYHSASRAALETGQLIAATFAMVNLGTTFAELNDYESAIEWEQKALDLARPTGWSVILGPCLRHMGEIMRFAERFDAAEATFAQALTVYAPLRNSRNFASLLGSIGSLNQARGNADESLRNYQAMAERAATLNQFDLLIEAQLGIAAAHLAGGEALTAQTAVQLALDASLRHGASTQHLRGLRLLAKIQLHQQHPAHALQSLRDAYAAAQAIQGYRPPHDLLLELANALALNGAFEEAYEATKKAITERERLQKRDSLSRATAVQIRLETERARAESEQHRRLAEAESRRAALLQNASDTLERLSTIGQEITSQLDKEHVFEAIERNVHSILDVTCFTIYLMDSDGLGLTSVYDVEDGVRLPVDQVELSDPNAFSAQCVRERRELLFNRASTLDAPHLAHIPGTLLPQSALFAPLIVADRVMGVMTIQSLQLNAYGDNERLIFRTLCAYAAIALDNSVAYTHLRDAKDQLVAHEKLSALGALVAGVAHELNTPLGNALLTATALQEQTRELEAAALGGTMRRSTLTEYIAASYEGLELVTRGLSAAGELVQSFKQVAVDRATEQRRTFNILRTSQETLATLQRVIHRAGHRIEVQIPAELELDGYPGPFGQVLTNFINNALLHGFEGRTGGVMRLTARPLRKTNVEIQFSDDGRGIAADHLNRIFEPFFTTKMGQGGSGLGMSISHNIITSLFGGEMTVSSAPGEGTCFTLRLPVAAPQSSADGQHTHDVRKRRRE
jgi:signal transduction histidine kinase/tetratricopeptide (TPR) repeat protein